MNRVVYAIRPLLPVLSGLCTIAGFISLEADDLTRASILIVLAVVCICSYWATAKASQPAEKKLTKEELSLRFLKASLLGFFLLALGIGSVGIGLLSAFTKELPVLTPTGTFLAFAFAVMFFVLFWTGPRKHMGPPRPQSLTESSLTKEKDS